MAVALTKFAPAERADKSTLESQAKMLLDIELLDKLYGAVNEIVLILNRQRQIVFCNTQFAALLGHKSNHELIGLRPGEALGCIHSCEAGGCGTSEFCSTCGAVRAILSAQSGRPDIKECRILRGLQCDAMDLLVRATPIEVRGEPFTVFAVVDISHEKRRSALERVFFHDLMNTAVAIRMLSENLGSAGLGKISEVSSSICQGVQQLVEEIASQRDLIQAENNELPVRQVELASNAVLTQVLDTYGSFARMRRCELETDPKTRNTVFRGDPLIISRVIGNMIKNALEACREGQKVLVGSKGKNEWVTFWVHNPGFMPREVQLQLFKRSFTTKGAGRGLGTYSMKLLTERYLKGQISFTSTEADGTTFEIRLRTSGAPAE